MMLPILYSFRRCPYAMRVRLAIRACAVPVILREVSLKSKPQAMLAISPKATVPVVQLPDGRVLEQSLDVMVWAAGDAWLTDDAPAWIARNDGYFKAALDRYKYAERFPEQPMEVYRAQGEVFLMELNERLSRQRFLGGEMPSALDWAIFPFVRQFAGVDRVWFNALPFRQLINWLTYWQESDLFASIMAHHQPWQQGDPEIVF